MENKEKNSISESIKKLEKISNWFDDQDNIDLEEGLKKVKEGAKLIKETKEKLRNIKNEFEEIQKEITE
jgi:exodeoxyribonuclease VII small subunit